ncbi:sporulation inhibitor of replication protein SirA [Bacillus sp. Xin]|uniref:sporulation inhibitor of replication protein SirA n=1 Tax=unclassified Bacillus (in: firmicutes) TaxID=185979 RepID=UPI001571C0D9|nr:MULTISPECIES: sporulation inhibitor of replication protein SirA [unclassified Bacillus (in: firmicutes)]MBC6971596.1 sporulation inhibitor of replication protein SirA [Bacillus sp. Xin]NSW38326.1 sporulation inhibitor of replication protein SirA [Bacillus sp. Xin1]
MKTYELYLIQEDIAKAYFGREYLFFDLFARFSESGSLSKKKVLYKQMMYITMPLQVMKIHHKLEQVLRSFGKYDRTHRTHMLYTGAEYGEITVKSQYIQMSTSGNVSMETTFFEVLRKCELTFLAMDYENKKYGWLNPLKQARTYV